MKPKSLILGAMALAWIYLGIGLLTPRLETQEDKERIVQLGVYTPDLDNNGYNNYVLIIKRGGKVIHRDIFLQMQQGYYIRVDPNQNFRNEPNDLEKALKSDRLV